MEDDKILSKLFFKLNWQYFPGASVRIGMERGVFSNVLESFGSSRKHWWLRSRVSNELRWSCLVLVWIAHVLNWSWKSLKLKEFFGGLVGEQKIASLKRSVLAAGSTIKGGVLNDSSSSLFWFSQIDGGIKGSTRLVWMVFWNCETDTGVMVVVLARLLLLLVKLIF